jgi:putative Ca2+/H+ antiporter (TMEM165/GDT1 family)
MPNPSGESMEAFLISTLVVAIAEIGDKTQLLALLLAARFQKPIPIILGILAATLLNHAAAGWVGTWLGSLLQGDILRWALGISFLAVAIWTLIPDKMEADDEPKHPFGAFVTTLISFFLVEIGDKTQIATIALAARFEALVPVVIGTTLGMMLANIPAVLVGSAVAHRLPLKLIRIVAACIFAILGIAALIGFEFKLPF